MTWFAALLRGLVLALATLVLALAAGLLALERSGWLESRARILLASRLGEPIEVEAVRLRWLDAALELEGLSLGTPEARLERVRIVLRGGRGTLVRVARIEVTGGRVVVGRALQRRLASRPAEAAGAGPTTARRPAPTPAVAVRGVQVDLEQPGLGVIPLGELQATFSLDGQGRRRLAGRLLPGVDARPDGDDESPAFHWTGVEDVDGQLDTTLACDGMPIRAGELVPVALLERLRAGGVQGQLALECRARLSLDTLRIAYAELRARVSGGRLTLDGTDTPVSDVDVDLEARCAPGPGETAFDPGAWRALATARASWRGAVLETWAVWGSHAGRGLRGRGWVHLRDLPLDEATLGYLRQSPGLARTLDALEPRGRCELLLAGELPLEAPPRGALEVVCDGRAGLTYHGWPGLSGRPQGFPMPVEGVRGKLVGGVDPGRPDGLHLAIVRAQGAHTADLPDERTAQASGQIRRDLGAPPQVPGEVYLRLAGQRLPVDGGGIPAALAGLDGTGWIWPAFSPSGGEASFEALLSHRKGDAHLGAHFDIDVEGLEVAWEQLPVPATDLRGRLSLRFDPRRAWGAAFRIEGRTATSDRLGLGGRLLRDPATDPAREPLEGIVEELSIEVDNVALRGVDRQALEGVLPALGVALEQVAPAGKVDVRLRRSRAATDPEGMFVAEISPREVQFSPQAFRVPTRNVRGRVLVMGTRLLGEPGPADGPPGARVVLTPVVGEWPGEVLVGCTATFGPGPGNGSLEVFASGVAPLQRSVVGALQSAFAAPRSGYPGLDLSALSVDGRVDLDGRLELDERDAQRPAEGRFRVHLRDNAFRIAPPSGSEQEAGFGLDRLRGSLEQRGEVLSGTEIRARLGRTPLVLRDARFELLGEGGYRLEARPAATGLPLDREHLRFFLDPQTVDALVDELGFSGRLDIDDARLVLAGSRDGAGSVRLEGRVRPRAMKVDLGLPLEVDSAAVRVESLVFEAGQVRAWASVEQLDGSLAGRRLEDARLQLTYVEPRLSVFDLEGTLEGGRLADMGRTATSAGPAFSIDLQEPFRFDLGLRLVDVRVENLLRGLFESEFASRGVLSGELRLEGSLQAVREIRGDGALRLRDTTLWSIPVMQALFSQLGFDDTAVFERMRTRFQVRDGTFHMSDMQVYSPLLQLVGSGTLDMEGRLHHDLEVRYSLVDRLGPFTRLVYWVQNNLLRLAVRGDMARPRIELLGFLSVFQAPLASGRDLPLPGLTPLPARF